MGLENVESESELEKRIDANLPKMFEMLEESQAILFVCSQKGTGNTAVACFGQTAHIKKCIKHAITKDPEFKKLVLEVVTKLKLK